MKQPESATFYMDCQKARKYYLGLTTITQDVEDFINTDHGKAIVSNSTIQILLKQSPPQLIKLPRCFISQAAKNTSYYHVMSERAYFLPALPTGNQGSCLTRRYELVTSKPQEVLRKQPEDLAIPNSVYPPIEKKHPTTRPADNPLPPASVQNTKPRLTILNSLFR